MWCLRVIKLVVDDLWLRKPCCWGTKMFLKSGVILKVIILENILGRIEIIDIGR